MRSPHEVIASCAVRLQLLKDSLWRLSSCTAFLNQGLGYSVA